MAAANTNLFRKGTNNFSTTLSGAIGASDTTISLTSTTNLPTDTAITLVIDRVNASGTATPNTREYVLGVVSSTNLINVLRGQGLSTAQSHQTGAVVEAVWTSEDWNDALSGILNHANQDGTLQQSAVLAAIGTSNQTAGWTALGYPLTYGANNGNKEFTVTTPNNLTSFLSPGMKLQVTRSVTPPTQCMAFSAASSQYATKASPSGITFTSAFTCEAWVYLTAYPTGTNLAGIISRTDDITGGFALEVNASGQARIYYAGSSTFTDFISYQSVPLNRWVHIAGVVSSVSSKTGAVYINGVSVPTFQSLTSATTLVQTSNLSVGGLGAGVANRYFNGYISEARVWSVAQSQASIQANMAINCVGNETNLVALFQGSGNFNDLTSNANNLTATNGAIATQAANPYNPIEYAVVTKVSYSNPTTTLTLFTGTDYNIPNQTLNSPQYSTARAPYGFPAGRDKWLVDFQSIAQLSNITFSATNTWTSSNCQIVVPIGEWRLSYECTYQQNNGSAASSNGNVLLYPGTPTNGTISYNLAAIIYNGASVTNVLANIYREDMISVASDTTYTLYGNVVSGGGTINFQLRGDIGTTIIKAECAYI